METLTPPDLVRLVRNHLTQNNVASRQILARSLQGLLDLNIQDNQNSVLFQIRWQTNRRSPRNSPVETLANQAECWYSTDLTNLDQ